MRKLASLLLAMACLSTAAHAQKKISLPFSTYYDEDATVLIGLQYNVISQNYQLTLKDNWQKNYPIIYPDGDIDHLGELKSIHDASGIATSVGIPIDVRASDNLYFTFHPSFMYINNLGVKYTSMDPDLGSLTKRQKHVTGHTYGTNYNAFEFPLSVKFRSDEKFFMNKANRFRAYMVGGARYTRWFNIGESYERMQNTMNANQPVPQVLIMKPGYWSWEAGLGMDIFLPYFKLSPEIKFNQSFGNVFDNNSALAYQNKFMSSIERGLIRNIYFGLIFQ